MYILLYKHGLEKTEIYLIFKEDIGIEQLSKQERTIYVN